MSIDQDIANSARQLETDVRINHQITHGGDTVEVPTEGGPVPSIRKRLKDIETEWSKTADPLASDLASTVQVTRGYKDAAAASASAAAAETVKVTAEGVKQIKAVVDQGTLTIGQVKTEGGKQIAAASSQADRAAAQVPLANEQASRSKNYATESKTASTVATTAKEAAVAAGNTASQHAATASNEATRSEQEANAAATSAGESRTAANRAQEVAAKFGNVDQAIREARQEADRSASEASKAEGSAGSAELASTSAVNAKEVAISKAAEAKTAADNAVAIVHNDEGSLTSKPGAYPVADSKGHLDINWTPLLQAMYPYSGVMGDINKETTLFFAGSHPSYSNRIDVKSSAPPFNIAGRYVKPRSQGLTLPEAESTANQAIAFDDIFLDWNGTVTSYRSITPHRTTTGYDRDAIATEHGYSKIQKGLYKTGDTYALLLGRVARRNQGGYHPVYNPEGSCAYVNTANGGCEWWNSRLDEPAQPKNQEQCFYFRRTDGVYVHNSGKIGGVGWQLPRPDKKPYDAIYADDFTPLYYSARNVIDRQALLFDSFNRAVAGETFHASEGTVSGSILTLNDDYRSRFTGTEYITVSESSITFEAISQYQACTFNAGKGYTNFSLLKPTTFYFSSSVSRLTKGIPTWRIDYTDKDGKKQFPETGRMTSTGSFSGSITIPAGGTITRFYIQDIAQTTTGCDAIIENCIVYSDMPHLTDSARPQFLMVDIIGAQEAWPEEWKIHGLPGNWLAVGEEGESLIPDGTQKNFKLSRKCLECYQVLLSSDNGVTWRDDTSRYKSNFESASNNMNPSGQVISADTIVMVFYRTSANPFELASNTSAAALGTDSVLGTYNSSETAVLTNSLIGKTPVGFRFNIVNLKSHSRWTNRFHHGGDYRMPVNDVFPILEGTQISPTCKMLPYLSTNGYLHFVYKEIKLNGSWGDDSKFNIVDNQTTVTDLNGESVIVGQKRCEIPYIFDGVNY